MVVFVSYFLSGVGVKKFPALRAGVDYLTADSSDLPLNRIGVGFYLSISRSLICYLKGDWGVPRRTPFQAEKAIIGVPRRAPLQMERATSWVLRRPPFQA